MTVKIDEMYNINDDVMDAAKWEALGRVYEKLPSFSAYRKNIPYWFGTEAELHHLSASVEPPGLQIAGVLEERAWRQWDAAFKMLASQELGFEVMYLYEQ